MGCCDSHTILVEPCQAVKDPDVPPEQNAAPVAEMEVDPVVAPAVVCPEVAPKACVIVKARRCVVHGAHYEEADVPRVIRCFLARQDRR